MLHFHLFFNIIVTQHLFSSTTSTVTMCKYETYRSQSQVLLMPHNQAHINVRSMPCRHGFNKYHVGHSLSHHGINKSHHCPVPHNTGQCDIYHNFRWYSDRFLHIYLGCNRTDDVSIGPIPVELRPRHGKYKRILHYSTLSFEDQIVNPRPTTLEEKCQLHAVVFDHLPIRVPWENAQRLPGHVTS